MRTAEFVTPKHPDKMCDIISDTILDGIIEKDANARCTIQTMGGHDKVWIAGEVGTTSISDNEIKNIVKEVSGVEDVTIHLKKVPEQHSNVATDQGIAIGYATTESSTMVPKEYELARSLTKYIYDVYPVDGKVQVTLNGDGVEVVSSFQGTNAKDLEELIHIFFAQHSEKLVNQTLSVMKTYCNPLGTWNIGGFNSDVGITGGQAVLDNYGPRIPIGCGLFSGKDGSKVDRSAAYMARKIAIDAIKKYRLMYAIVELSYAIGKEQPVQARIKGNDKGINVETGIMLYEVQGYDLSINGIVQSLKLNRPNFKQTSAWGHFGNGFIWDE
jgi:S-adenosylmethionine synthetase